MISKKSYFHRAMALGIAGFGLAMGIDRPSLASTLSVSGSFTPGASDVSYLPGASDGVTGTNYTFSSGAGGYGTYIDSGSTFGQTFTTGSNATGYTLTAITTIINFNYEANNGYNFPLSITGGAVNYNDVPAATAVPAPGQGDLNGDYLKYTFTTPVALAANTVYTITFGELSTGGSGAMNFVATSDNYYAGGAAFTNNPGEGTNGKTELAFDAALVPAVVPEPATFGLLAIFGAGMVARRRRA